MKSDYKKELLKVEKYNYTLYLRLTGNLCVHTTLRISAMNTPM